MSLSFRHGAALLLALVASSAFGQGLQPPANLIATSATNSMVQLTWTAAQPQAPGFIVEMLALSLLLRRTSGAAQVHAGKVRREIREAGSWMRRS